MENGGAENGRTEHGRTRFTTDHTSNSRSPCSVFPFSIFPVFRPTYLCLHKPSIQFYQSCQACGEEHHETDEGDAPGQTEGIGYEADDRWAGQETDETKRSERG